MARKGNVYNNSVQEYQKILGASFSYLQTPLVSTAHLKQKYPQVERSSISNIQVGEEMYYVLNTSPDFAIPCIIKSVLGKAGKIDVYSPRYNFAQTKILYFTEYNLFDDEVGRTIEEAYINMR